MLYVCGVRRAAVHVSLLALYGLGGLLVSRGALPIRVLLSGIGFTFSLVFATQGCVQSFSDLQRAAVSLTRSVDPFIADHLAALYYSIRSDLCHLHKAHCCRLFYSSDRCLAVARCHLIGAAWK